VNPQGYALAEGERGQQHGQHEVVQGDASHVLAEDEGRRQGQREVVQRITRVTYFLSEVVVTWSA
jgi:hypothetical protein